MTDTNLNPDYLSIDFYSLIERVRDQIKNSLIFTDIDYEGSNINILIELFAYISELNVFYLNRLAKNQYIDTADIYENVHRISNLLGYNPKGYISSTGRLNISITGLDSGKTLYIDSWTQFVTDSNITDANSDPIYFITTNKVYGDYSTGNTYNFTNIPIRQGKIVSYLEENNTNYTGQNIINNKLYLPVISFAYDNNLLDTETSIKLYVNGEKWHRVDNFYDSISGLTQNNNVYRFLFDKNQMYYIEFSQYKNVPIKTDIIEMYLLKSIGADGNLGFNSITQYDDILHNSSNFFIIDETTGLPINPTLIELTINNNNVINGGSNPENIDTIRENTKQITNTQYRNVTKSDYITYLENHSEIVKATVWGEQDIYPDGGNFYDYNKIYICMLPSNDQTLWENYIYTNKIELDNGSTLYIPISSTGTNGYYSNYVQTIAEYLEPRKMLCAYETYSTPHMIYFRFDISIKIKTNYRYDRVLKDLKRKMSWYFNISNRKFKETIYFTDIINKMIDSNYIDTINSDYFTQTKGISNIIFRKISYYDVYSGEWIEPNPYNSEVFPRYLKEIENDWINYITDVELNLNQFPLIEINGCEWNQL